MHRWAFLIILWASPALAQWVEFTPCGLKDPFKHALPYEVPEGPASSIGPYWVWVPAVVAVMGVKRTIHTEVDCSMVHTFKEAVLVIGTTDEVLKKLGKK